MSSVYYEDSPVEEQLLLPYTHIRQIPSKEMRKRIQSSFNHWLRVPKDKFDEIVDITEMLHVCSLIADDIQDDTQCRRGIPSAHVVYGVPLAINSFTIVLMKILERCMRLHPKAALIYREQVLMMFRGQGEEVYWRDNFVCPKEEHYKRMLTKKTAGVFLFCYRALQLFSEEKIDYTDFVIKLGFYFQLRDDYCNICQQKGLEEMSQLTNENSRDFYDDLTEGKFTLPIIYATRTSKADTVLNILRQKTRDITLKKYFVSLLEECGGLQYTREIMKDLDSSLRDEIKKFGGNPALIAVMDEMLSWQNS
ncbi:terpene synthase-like [Leptidea sinapis]|uniref:Geranylgeranyl pyrophosphate synthase n=1 Tax=Leptidea sinapis TaxID=189913 RepID=A0A5E4R100_9NEOP|nr:terpene synthase-like [Leptidea sinapis]VVD04150.1 unnamed protein product [Leptidea sinapis]